MKVAYRDSDLTLGGPLGRGGTSHLWECTVPERSDLVYKKYKPEILPDLNPDVLLRLIEFRTSLPDGERDRLDEKFAWLLAVVVSGDGQTIGVLCSRADDRFFQSNDATRHRSKPWKLSEIGRERGSAQKLGNPYYPVPYKMALLGDLLISIDFLHRRGFVVGDLNPNNVLVTGPSEPRVSTLVIDCDSIGIGGIFATPVLDPIAFKPSQELMPDGKFSQRTDLYKFTLLASRSVEENWGGSVTNLNTLRTLAATWAIDHLQTVLRPGTAIPMEINRVGSGWRSCVSPSGLLRTWMPDGRYQPWARATDDPVPPRLHDPDPEPSQLRGDDLAADVKIPRETARTGGFVLFAHADLGAPVSVPVPRAIATGEQIRMHGHGMPGPSGPGDLVLTADVEPEARPVVLASPIPAPPPPSSAHSLAGERALPWAVAGWKTRRRVAVFCSVMVAFCVSLLVTAIFSGEHMDYVFAGVFLILSVAGWLTGSRR